MQRRTKLIAGGLGVAALLVGGAGYAMAGGADDDAGDQPITGPALEHATAVALQETGGGRVTETEVHDEESYYQVEVTLDDGSQVDVNLDEQFNIVKTKVEHETDDD